MEILNNQNENIEEKEVTLDNQTESMPYHFRKLKAKDMPSLIKILRKINIKNFKNCFQSEDAKELFKKIMDEENHSDENKEGTEDTALAMAGGTILLDIVQVILEGLDGCVNDVNELLASVSEKNISELENMDFDIYAQMIIDFIKKEEFKGFLKVALKSMK